MDILRLHVLLVNEDPSLLESMGSLLEEHGFTYSSACNLKAAQSLLEQERFQVIVSDITMPDNDGIELCRKFGNSLPVVMLQGKVDLKILEGLGRYGCCFLEKQEISTRLPKAIWTAFKRFRIDQQIEKDLVAA